MHMTALNLLDTKYVMNFAHTQEVTSTITLGQA